MKNKVNFLFYTIKLGTYVKIKKKNVKTLK